MRILKGGIAFFDSGIGGMTVLRECEKVLKNEYLYYYGDNKNAPYGNLPLHKIKKRVNKAFKLFNKLKVKAVVIACNTATAICIDELREKYTFPIIGAEPAVMEAVRRYNGAVQNNAVQYNNLIGDALQDDTQANISCQKSNKQKDREVCILTTRTTYNSKRFQDLCARAQKNCDTLQMKAFACDRLAGLIEKNIANKEFDYTSFLPVGDPAVVVLGCTHYIYIKQEIEQYYHCLCVDGNLGIAKSLIRVLGDMANDVQEMAFNEKNHKSSKISKKNRKVKPPISTFDPVAPPNVNFDKDKGRIRAKNKANKCSHFLRKMSKPLYIKERGNYVYFCGSGKRYNALFYKQLFVFNQKTR